jgi:tetratricopeptide (TPR) repeat protein
MLPWWHRLTCRPLWALLVALATLLLAEQLAGHWGPAREPEFLAWRNQQRPHLLRPEQAGFKWAGLNDLIPPRREGGPFRILLLGSSGLRGNGSVPFQSIPGHLQRLLNQEGIPVEAINGGVPGSESAQQLQMLQEGLDQLVPDLVVHYGGNNEFFRLLIYKHQNPRWTASAERTRSVLQHLALYRWLADIFQQPSPRLDMAGKHISDLPSTIAREDISLVQERYERNLMRMGELCRERGVKLVLCAVAVNEVFPPKDPVRTFNMYSRADSREEQQEEFLKESCRLNPDRAQPHHAYGMWLLREGRKQEATTRLARAIELDPLPIRAMPSQNLCVQRAAAASGALFLDVPAGLHRVYGPVLGMEVFLSHVHLHPHASRVVAQDLARLLKSRRLLPEPTGPARAEPDDPLDLEAFTNSEDCAAGLRHQEVEPELADLVLEGHSAFLGEEFDLAIEHYRRALGLAPERAVLWRNLGHALAQARRLSEAMRCWQEFLDRGGEDDRLVYFLRIWQEKSGSSPDAFGNIPAHAPRSARFSHGADQEGKPR